MMTNDKDTGYQTETKVSGIQQDDYESCHAHHKTAIYLRTKYMKGSLFARRYTGYERRFVNIGWHCDTCKRFVLYDDIIDDLKKEGEVS